MSDDVCGGQPAIHVHNYPADMRLEQVLKLLRSLTRKVEAMAFRFEDMLAAVQANGDAVNSAVTAFQTIAGELRAALDNGDDEQLRALTDQLTAQSQSLAAAVVANTPAPQPAPEPAPVEPTPDPAPAPTPPDDAPPAPTA